MTDATELEPPSEHELVLTDMVTPAYVLVEARCKCGRWQKDARGTAQGNTLEASDLVTLGRRRLTRAYQNEHLCSEA